MKVAHPIDEDGRVYCVAQQKTVDVLSCYGCERLVDIDVDSRHPRVTCEAERPEARRPSAR